MSTDKYILNDKGEPEACDDLMTWGKWFQENDDKRIVAKDILGDVRISTIFLGLDHQFGDGEPILWETMIFGGPHDQYQNRYSTKADAIAGHAEAVKMATQPQESK